MSNDTDDLRRALQAALRQRDTAQGTLRQAQSAHGRATTLLQQAEGEAAKFADIASREARAIADAIRNGVTPELPKSLRDAKAAKAKAEEQVRLARAAERTLAADVEVASARFTDAEAVAEQAAVAVAVAEADALAVKLQDAENRAKELRSRLLGVARVWLPVGGRPQALPLSARVRGLLTHPPCNSLAVADQGWQAAWAAWGRALLSDPAAPAPQSAQPVQRPQPAPAVPWEAHRTVLEQAARERQRRVDAEAQAQDGAS